MFEVFSSMPDALYPFCNGHPNRENFALRVESSKRSLLIAIGAALLAVVIYIVWEYDTFGWLEPDDVLNTRSWDEIKKMFKRK